MENNTVHESRLTVHDDGFRVLKDHHWGTEKYEFDRHLVSQFTVLVLGRKIGEGSA